MGGISFLTPSASVFALAALVPLGALALAHLRSRAVHQQLRLPAPPPRRLVLPVVAVVMLGGLVAVAAAQPIVVRRHDETARTDAQVFVVFDTSLSMRASSGPQQPTRLARAKRMAVDLQRALPNVPFGVVSMTDRALPNLMPTVDRSLFDRTVQLSVGIDRPPPSQEYHGRATTFDAIVALAQANFFSRSVHHRVIVVFTDGEAQQMSPLTKQALENGLTPFFVHVWRPTDRIREGTPTEDRYIPDPTSGQALETLVAGTTGKVFGEHNGRQLVRSTRQAVGRASSASFVAGYARVPLAEWFILAAFVPLAFLIWKRNA